MITISDVIPPLRSDLRIIPAEENGESFMIIFDPMGFAEESITLLEGAFAIAELADGTKNASDLSYSIFQQTGERLEISTLLRFFQTLDDQYFLESPRYLVRVSEVEQTFISAPIRPAVCVGSSYPADAEKLREFLREIMESVPSETVEAGATAILAPHIDLRVGRKSYAPSFHALRDSPAELFVIFATSHYGWQDLFILTEKDFETPLGIIPTDKDLVRKIYERVPYELTRNDIAHKPEHSIELELVFLQYLFPNRPFTILPILVTSFFPFIEHDILPVQTERFSTFVRAVRAAVEESGKKAVYIASGDLAHIGRKFGDDFDAETILEALKNEDAEILAKAEKADATGFFSVIANNKDERRICGLPPLYSLLETLKPTRGTTLCYDQWNEVEARSAVSFGGVAYYE